MIEQLKQYKKALSIGKLGFWQWDAITNVTYWGDEKFELFGYEPQEFEVTFEKAFSTMHPDDVPMVMQLLQEKMPTHQLFDYEYRGITKQGNVINVWVQVEVLKDTTGNSIGLSGISQNITERKKLEEEIKVANSSLENKVAERTIELESKVKENELLLKEMHHRVKNNLQIISSILRLQKDYLDDALTIASLDECVSRIKSMALIHESLYARDNLSSIDIKLYFKQLMEYHFHIDSKTKYTLDLPELHLEIGKMLPLGMIVNELISNSIKHGFTEENKNEIILHIKNCDGFLDVKYSDNGTGCNVFESNRKPSFGMDLIKTLVADLNSELVFEKEGEGFGINFRVK